MKTVQTLRKASSALALGEWITATAASTYTDCHSRGAGDPHRCGFDPLPIRSRRQADHVPNVQRCRSRDRLGVYRR